MLLLVAKKGTLSNLPAVVVVSHWSSSLKRFYRIYRVMARNKRQQKRGTILTFMMFKIFTRIILGHGTQRSCFRPVETKLKNLMCGMLPHVLALISINRNIPPTSSDS